MVNKEYLQGLNNPPELSPGLEWMLNSNQVSDDLILDALIEEHFEPLYHLFHSLTGNPDLVFQAVAETFANVLFERHRIASNLDVKSFIYVQAVQVYLWKEQHARQRQVTASGVPDESRDTPQSLFSTVSDSILWPAVDGLSEDDRLMLLLHAVCGFTVDDLSVILDEDNSQINRRLGASLRSLSMAIDWPVHAVDRLKEAVGDSIRLQWQANPPPPDSEWLVRDAARALLQHKARLRLKYSRFTQVVFGGFIVAIILAISFITNRITDLQSASPLAVRTIVETRIVHITVVVTGTPAPNRLQASISPYADHVFDPASSRLEFEYQESRPPQMGEAEAVAVDVYADGNFLGQVQISDPWSSSCERSPDGRYLALVERPDLPPFPFSRLRLLQVPGLDSLDMPLPRGSRYGHDVAFSPDSRYLAFWGCGGGSGCGVYILDLDTREAAMLLPGRYAGYFAWSPNGDEIAMLRADGSLIIANTSSGDITYEQAVDWADIDIPNGAPIYDWGFVYPPIQSDLRGCEGPILS